MILDLVIVLTFVLLALGSGLKASGRASENLEEYFLAGRRLRGWQSGLSMAATQYAADTPLLATGLMATGGVFLLWRFWIYGFGYLLLAFVFAECWRRARVITDAELTEIRYSGSGVLALRTLKAIYFGTVVNGIFLAMVLLAGVRIAEVFLPWHEWVPPPLYRPFVHLVGSLGWGMDSVVPGLAPHLAAANALLSLLLILAFVSLYSTLGGLRGVVTTDVIQFGFVMVGTVAYAALILQAVGGLSGLGRGVIELYGEARAGELFGLLPSGGARVLLPFLVIIGLQGLFWIGSDGTGYLAQRAMACETDADARAAGIVVAWVQVFVRSLLWLLIGAGLLVLYPFSPGETAVEGFAAAREMTFVAGIDELMPPGLRGIMLAGLLAALASTVDTHLNWGASYWTRDLYERLFCGFVLKRGARGKELVIVARLSNLVVLLVALLVMGRVGSIQGAWFVSLLFGAGIGGVLMLRWLWRRINLWSEAAALLVSLGGAPLLLVVVPQEWVRLLLMVVTGTSAAILAALLGPVTDPGVLEGFQRKVRPPGWWAPEGRSGWHGEATSSLRDLWIRVRSASLMTLSLFLSLTALVRLLLPLPGGRGWWPWVFLLGAVLIFPFWWRSWESG